MRLILTLSFFTTILHLSPARVPQGINVSSSTVSTEIDQHVFTQSQKARVNDERHIKRLEIRNQAGLDGKVRKIHLNSEEDRPGIRAYGLQKKRLRNNGVIERILMKEDQFRDASRNGRLVEAYGMPKDHVETNGFIERTLHRVTVHRQPTLRNEDARARRSIRTGSENKFDRNIANEAEDMEAQEAKVFRPFFVYKQQVAARQKRKHSRNFIHRNHRHATHHTCSHTQHTIH